MSSKIKKEEGEEIDKLEPQLVASIQQAEEQPTKAETVPDELKQTSTFPTELVSSIVIESDSKENPSSHQNQPDEEKHPENQTKSQENQQNAAQQNLEYSFMNKPEAQDNASDPSSKTLNKQIKEDTPTPPSQSIKSEAISIQSNLEGVDKKEEEDSEEAIAQSTIISPAIVFVNNLNPNVSSSDLGEFCSENGPVLSNVIEFQANGISAGYGFVVFNGAEVAQEFIKNVDGTEVGGTQLSVSMFLPKEDGPNPIRRDILFLTNFPDNYGEDVIRRFVKERVVGVIDCKILMKAGAEPYALVALEDGYEGVEEHIHAMNGIELMSGKENNEGSTQLYADLGQYAVTVFFL
jgi:RNA recognition motif-containing protein